MAVSARKLTRMADEAGDLYEFMTRALPYLRQAKADGMWENPALPSTLDQLIELGNQIIEAVEND